MDDKSSWWRAGWVAWTLGLTAIGLMAANLAFMFADRNVTLPQTSGGWSSVNVAMQNVAKYAHASNVVVQLRREHDDLAFSVSDDGVGFQRELTRYGMGLQNIADRLAALGGMFDVRTAPGEGTTVLGRVPATSR